MVTMSRTTLKAKKYYDWQDIKKHFGFKDLKDVFEPNVHFNGNHSLATIYGEDIDDYSTTQEKNRQRIFDTLGKCDIHIWW